MNDVRLVFEDIPSVRVALAPLSADPLRTDGLTPAEIATADGFSFENRRREWIAARLLLKSLFPDAPPTTLEVRADDRGRPFLVRDGRPLPFDVSLSHGGGFVAAARALTDGVRLGIDVEQASPRLTEVERMFRTPEDRLLREDDRTLLTLWTLKEAASKAQGTGLASDFRAWSCVEAAPGLFNVRGPHAFAGQGRVHFLDTLAVALVIAI